MCHPAAAVLVHVCQNKPFGQIRLYGAGQACEGLVHTSACKPTSLRCLQATELGEHAYMDTQS